MNEKDTCVDMERLEALLWRFLALDKEAQERVLQEVREAVSAGWEVLHLTDVITKALDRIRGAGRMDLLSDSVLPDLYKHKLLNEMQKDIGRLQVALRRFNSEASQAHAIINADLPQTGGIGTLMFIVIGGVLMAGGICLVSTGKKRAS